MDANIPFPDPSTFTTKIDNPLMTLRPGTTFVYENKETGEEVLFTVTRETKVVNGVTCVVVHDIAKENGLVIEDTYDWFAQDGAGNVWYFGEATQSFEPGNPDPISSKGSWEAGVGGAKAGIVMLADPQVGDHYRQEFAPGIAEDKAEVLSLGAVSDVAYGSFDGVLKTKDINPLDPSVENKYYAPGVGNILTTNADGEREQLTKIIINGTAAGEKLLGYAGGDHIYGRGGNDTTSGGSGNDTVHGGAGNDRIMGNSGHDDLNGGAGNDWLSGGGGADTFFIRNLTDGVKSIDTIADYDASQVDVIDLAKGAASIASEEMVGGVWQLTLKGDGDIVKLVGVSDENNNGHIIDELLIL